MATQDQVSWYRSPVPKEIMDEVRQRSNAKGLAQTLGYLAVLAGTGFASVWSISNLHPALTVLVFLVHGLCFSFMLNGFHELSHSTVFKSRALNTFFFRLFSFLSWNNHVFFKRSHTVHHASTLHYPDDMEVILPVKLTAKEFFTRGIVNPIGFIETFYGTVRFAFGIVRGKVYSGLGAFGAEWLAELFPPEDSKERRQLVNWARFTLLGHVAIAVVSILLGAWYIPLVVSVASFYGNGFLYFINPTQHIGLMDNVPDYRLNSRTIYVNPILQFLYWHMNFHIEHHMYAAIPCYNLPKLHRAIKADLPETPRGLIRTWSLVRKIEKRQAAEPDYQFNALQGL